MEDSSDVVLSPKKIKKSRWGPVTASDSPRKSSTEESGKVIPNGTGNNSSENSPKEEVKEKPRIVKITKVVKSAKTELTKARSKSPPKEESEPVSTSTPCDSPTTSQLSEDGFLGFDSVGLQDKQDTIHRILVELKASSGNASSSHLLDEESEVGETDGENSRREEEMTVDSDTGRDSDQMEIDMGNDKDTLSDSGEFSDKHDKSGERTKDSDVEIMETDSVRSDLEQSPKKVQENNVTKTDDKDASSSILESTLKGKPPTVKTDGKPLLSVRKDLAKVLTPSPTKRRSLNKDGSTRSPKIDISNPAFLKPFDYGWKRELVYRSTNDSHNRRQGDIYYYTPQGKKLRSLREICDHLVGSDLTQDNFTFWKEPLGLEDPQKEIIRDAKLKLKDPLASPTVTKKVIPKITKVQKTTPKLTATVPPLDSSIAPPTSTTPKASASVTPRVVFKGKNSLSSGPKFKVTPSKNTVSGQTPKIIISKGESTKRQISSGNEATNPPRRPYEAVISDPRGSEPIVENNAAVAEDVEMNRRNKFRRYGLLANAKTPRKIVPKFGHSSSSSSSDESSDSERRYKTELGILTPLTPDLRISEDKSSKIMSVKARLEQKLRQNIKATCLKPSEKEKLCHNASNADSPRVPQFAKSALSSNLTLPSNTDRSLLLNSKKRPTPPEIQFRPSNPSSYGCQTSSVTPCRSTGPNISVPSSSFYSNNMINCTSPFETVLIVDTSSRETYIRSPKHSGRTLPYESPLILNNSDCSIEIVNVESLNYPNEELKSTGSYHVAAGTKTKSPALRMHKPRLNECNFPKGTEHSPVSITSSSTEDIVIVDEELDDSNPPPFLIRNSPPPKLSRSIVAPNRSPPSLQPNLPPPRLSPRPKNIEVQEHRPFSSICNSPKEVLGKLSDLNNAKNKEITQPRTVAKATDYRKMKKERFYKRLKEKKTKEEEKKRRQKEKDQFIKRRSDEKRLLVKYLELKIKLKKAQLSALRREKKKDKFLFM